ncbi:MAG: LPXTG cell wall anchor domain-containing protein [Lachnospiraceae bacterium]|nr:LPXTG cell wall anchor domain-containing protein [Lachnospiraceae bacterium]
MGNLYKKRKDESAAEKEYIYTLTETKAPAGYRLMDAVRFTVSGDGTIVLKENKDGVLPENVKVSVQDGVAVLTAGNEPITVKFLKRLTGDTVAGGVAGAEFTLEAAEGRTLANGKNSFSWISKTEAVINVPKTGSSTVQGLTYQEKTGTVTVWNDPASLTIQKKGTVQKDAVFEITGVFGDDGKESTKTFVSAADGTVDLSKLVNEYNLRAGHRYVYVITETKAPTGYKALEGSVYFRVIRTEEGRAQVQVLSQTPAAIRGKLSLSTATENANLSILDIVNEKLPGSETPNTPETPDTPGTPDGSGGSGSGSGGSAGTSTGTSSGGTAKSVKTGDDTNYMFYVWLMLLSAAVAGGTAVSGKRRRKKR